MITSIHVVLVANTLWSIYNFRKGLIKSLISKGNKVTVVGPEDQYSSELQKLGCAIELVPISSQGMNPLTDLILIYRLKIIYDRLNPDFIFHYTIKPNIYGSIAAGLSRKNSIAITTGLGYVFNKSSWFTNIISRLYSFSFKYAKEVWFLNEDDKNIFLDKKLVQKNKAFVLDGEGVDTDYFTSKKCAHLPDSSKITFLLIARMLWDKGVGVYIDAAKLVKEEFPYAHFQLLGACDVQNPSAISSEIIETWHKEGMIEYLGVTKDVRSNICQADCVVLPSYYREGIPRTLMEAASMSKIVITTDNVGCKNVVIDGETGFLCEVKSASSLADAMRKVICCNAEKRYEMGLKGREFMLNRFDEKVIVDIYFHAIEKHINIPKTATLIH